MQAGRPCFQGNSPVTLCPNTSKHCVCQPQEGVMCPYGPTPEDWNVMTKEIDPGIPMLATLRGAEDDNGVEETHIECRFRDGQKYAAIRLEPECEELAALILRAIEQHNAGAAEPAADGVAVTHEFHCRLNHGDDYCSCGALNRGDKRGD